MKLNNKINRKEFLKLSAITALFGFGGSKAISLYASSPVEGNEADNNKKNVRLGMVIDTRKCPDNCTACMDACHIEHNVPDHKTKKDEIKWIWKEPAEHLFSEIDYNLQTSLSPEKPMLTLCNHCKNPPCVRVCPTQATWKSESDGIVNMDFHRCIGCRFCMAACPYGSRSFNFKDPRKGLDKINPDFPTRTIGVVEKCNFCSERIVEGKKPHCVISCKENAITYGDLNDPDSKIRSILSENNTLRRKAELGTGPSIFYIS